MENLQIINQLKLQGRRITQIRKLVINIFGRNRLPVSELEIRIALRKQGIAANKTTIYRELAVLKNLRLIKEADFGDGKKRYELDRGDHHHHLICTGCKKVGEITVCENLSGMEKQIKKQKLFAVSSHSLEFFGLCQKCANNH